MARLLTGVWLILMLQVSVASEAGVFVDASVTSPVQDFNFKIFINDKEAGSHSFRLQQQGENLLVSSRMNLEFKVFRVRQVKYSHSADEVWQGGCLISLKSETRKQGVPAYVNASIDSGSLVVVNGKGSETITGCARSFAYWNPALLKAESLLNSESGQYLPVEISSNVVEPENITHMTISGPKADIRLQYDSAGNWLSLESDLQFGNVIRYQRTTADISPEGGL